MKYNKVINGRFLERPNRFIAYVDIDGEGHTVHVKNTGRCKELLTPNAKVILEESSNPNRKTKYDLIAVYKGHRLINMDSLAPNKVVSEYLEAGRLIKKPDLIKAEYKHGNSRFDFYAEAQGKKYLIEVKGVTLEEDNIVMFPDAPTERGIKHINELVEAQKQGFISYIIFVVQMNNVKYFTPNAKTHKAFADALIRAKNKGINIMALDCIVTENSLTINKDVNIIL